MPLNASQLLKLWLTPSPEPVMIHPCALGSALTAAHIKSMPHKGSSRRTPDLFEYTIAVPTPPSQRAATPAKPPEITSLSDAHLVQDLAALIDELRRRLETGRGSRAELEQAAKQASLSLKRLVPSPTRQNKPSRSGKTSSVLQEGQRKAVRAALLAGVAPSQVAKHFRLSPATVRKVLEETT
jgi:hypothetical protein